MRMLLTDYALDESGASAIEYALVASLISVSIIAALTVLGVNLRDKALGIADAIASAGS